MVGSEAKNAYSIGRFQLPHEMIGANFDNLTQLDHITRDQQLLNIVVGHPNLSRIHKVQKAGQSATFQTLYHNPITTRLQDVRSEHSVKVRTGGRQDTSVGILNNFVMLVKTGHDFNITKATMVAGMSQGVEVGQQSARVAGLDGASRRRCIGLFLSCHSEFWNSGAGAAMFDFCFIYKNIIMNEVTILEFEL